MTDANPDPSAEDFSPGDETATTELFESISQIGSDTKYLLRKERQLTRIEKSLSQLGLFEALRSSDSEGSWVSIDEETNEIVFSAIPPERFSIFALHLEEILEALQGSFSPRGSSGSAPKQLALSPVAPGSISTPHLGGRV